MSKIMHLVKVAVIATAGVYAVTYLLGMIPGVKTFIKSVFNPA